MAVALFLLLANRHPFQTGLQTVDPSAAPESPLLSAEDKAILSEVLRLQADLGEDLWPGYGRANIPIILYNERYLEDLLRAALNEKRSFTRLSGTAS